MKKRFTAFLTTLILCVLFSISASADVVVVNGISYDISGTTATVTSCDANYSFGLVIPESITFKNSTYSVTSIGREAFNGCWRLTSVTIPNSVTSIGDYAFYDCSSLTSVTIPNSVTSIGNSAFYECISLTHPIIVNDMFVFLPTGYEGHYSIPENISTIIGGAFYGCSSLTSVTIPNSVTSIGVGAFYGCSSLTSVTIPNSVTSIGNGAFKNCGNIENFYCYAEEVPSASYNAFDGFSNDATLYVPASAIEAYKTTEPWSYFGTIKAIDTTEGVESVKDRVISIQSASGFVNISGLNNNETVSFYALDGEALGTAKSIDGNISFSAKQGTIVVARIGKESVKIAVK